MDFDDDEDLITSADLEDMTKSELLELAEACGVTADKNISKADLIDLLMEEEAEQVDDEEDDIDRELRLEEERRRN